MEIEFTPRFHKIGSSRLDLMIIEETSKIRKNTSKNLSKYKNIIKSKSCKKVNTNKSCKTFNIDDLRSIENQFNSRHKFFLRNDFDKEHCKIFLKEKYLCLEKPILFDEICI